MNIKCIHIHLRLTEETEKEEQKDLCEGIEGTKTRLL